MKIKKEPKRIVIELTDEEHKVIKMDAANKGLTIRKYVLNAIVEQGKLNALRDKE